MWHAPVCWVYIYNHAVRKQIPKLIFQAATEVLRMYAFSITDADTKNNLCKYLIIFCPYIDAGCTC